jgi:hypothetical protein
VKLLLLKITLQYSVTDGLLQVNLIIELYPEKNEFSNTAVRNCKIITDEFRKVQLLTVTSKVNHRKFEFKKVESLILAMPLSRLARPVSTAKDCIIELNISTRTVERGESTKAYWNAFPVILELLILINIKFSLLSFELSYIC